ncbi:MAG: hypothetical protein KIT80_23420 [Chitinophagaceae bacterium]|nr:hypothetical protein [Nitrosomonas sp.]MCW5929890.1 hypothetical protein [Chitinophagaceae bacterium]
MNTEKKSHIHAQCLTSDKAMWVKAAQSKKMKLTEWIITTLNKEIEKLRNEKDQI